MKQLLILLAIVAASVFSTKAQYITIPDPAFRNELIQKYPSCFNASEQMDTTCTAINNETFFKNNAYISDWQGFQYFRNLEYIHFGAYATPPVLPATVKTIIADLFSTISTLPALPNGLLYLDCQGVYGLTSIPALPNTLLHLRCSNCHELPGIPALPASLQYLNVSENHQFTSLPVLSTALDTLICSSNSLTALPALPAGLRVLDCSRNTISVLPTLPAALKSLNFSNNNVTALPSLPSQLEVLNAIYNQLGNLPTLPSTLVSIDVRQNSIAVIPALPGSIQSLECSFNALTSLPTLPAGLLSLNCRRNSISTIPALPASLLSLDVSENLLSSLPSLPAGLNTLNCTSNQISTLPTLPATITTLYVGFNQLTSIPSFPPLLTSLGCGANQLTNLPPLPATLQELECAGNQLTSLPDLPGNLRTINCQTNNITCMPVLPNGPGFPYPVYITFDDIINCIPNAPSTNYEIHVYHNGSPTGSYNSSNPYPLCSAVNNANQCAAFPLMTGHVFYDNNSNGIKDAAEPYRANVKVELSDGSYTFSNSNGYYQVAASDTGSYSISATEAPVYFATVPAQYNFHFSSFDTIVVNDFGLQATATRDSLGIHINTINTARPGFPYAYQIAYSNDGTTTLNSNVAVNYDNTRLIFDSCSNASVINTGSSLTLSEPGFVPGMQKNFIGYFRVNPTAVIGDSLRAGAHIVSGNVAAHDSNVVEIRGSFDPNDKSATPAMSPAQVINGDYIYYTIRFQNTGTDTAFNIVVTDTLSSQLQASTLQMINTSHPCITTVKNNAISFEFINILLPDSNVNELKSHGFISFRIKPLNTLVVNDIVPNKAAIYFDYNSPVITNIATTTIVDPIVVPLKLLSFNVSRGVGKQANLYWQTSHEVNVQHYEIEMSSNGRIFTNMGTENAKGRQYNSYTKTIAIPGDAVLYFRLKMMDIDGRYTYSTVVILKNDNSHAAFSFLNNPIKDELGISLQDESLRNTKAIIFNSQGVKIRTFLLQHDVENINVTSLSAGTYYLVTEKGSQRFIVIK